MANAASNEVISLPKGGGAVQGLGEKFAPDLHTGTGNFTVPITLPPGRNGFQPSLQLAYSTGNGNGPFGLGWQLGLPGISRKTSGGIPRYDDAVDVFILAGAEDLVPVRRTDTATWYRPRTEGLFAEIIHHLDAQTSYWEVRSVDGLVSYYGMLAAPGADAAVIADPLDRSKIFAWKLTRTEDRFGNRIDYEYTRDWLQQGARHWDQLYLRHIVYADYHDERGDRAFLVSVNLDYDDRDALDAFSDYRAGFEIRTRKRCASIRLRTHAGQDRDTRSYQFIYLDQRPALQAALPFNGASLLSQIIVSGHDAHVSEAMPPLELHYTAFEPGLRDFFPLKGDDLPARSLANAELELVDLFGNGLPDFVEMNGSARYWRNLGNGRFDRPRFMHDAPAGVTLVDPGVQLIDANGDGRADLLVSTPLISGYYPLRFRGHWDRASFQRFRQAPSFALDDPEVKLVDLSGDGVTDAIRSGSRLECFFNHPRDGWHSTRQVERRALDVFPNVNFSDPRVKWADMSGDNLQDIVLVHDGSIAYWPNLGYGNWGKRIDMAHSPRFPAGYDPRRILVGDVDGDGLADLVYIGDQQVTLWINQSGNRWSAPITISGTPAVTNLDAVRLIDLLGTGISGILWSRDAGAAARGNLFFLDFTGGRKPYLLAEMDNHIGAVTRVAYQPSTQCYLDDQLRPHSRWKTSLPFPVHVVASVTVNDHFSTGKLSTEYRYHHGHWDGAEREFRGFGMVEQFDSESFEQQAGAALPGAVARQYFAAPLCSKTWFHQGPVGDEYGDWHELDWSDQYWKGDPHMLGHTEAVNQFLASRAGTADSRRIKRDALRALRGSTLRSELYAIDGSAREERPYTVSETRYGLVEIAPPGAADPDRLRIFYPHTLAQRTTEWERGNDPMTQCSYTGYLDANGVFDPFGRALSHTQIACPRGWRTLADRPADAYLATRSLTVYAAPNDAATYIHNRVARTSNFEIVDTVGKRVGELAALGNTAAELVLIGHARSYYDGAAFVGLPQGQLGAFGAITRSESLGLTDDILSKAYGAQIPPYLEPTGQPAWTPDYPPEFRALLARRAGYVFHPGSANPADPRGYFVNSRRQRYDFQSGMPGQGLVLETLDPLHDAAADPSAHRALITHDKYAMLPATVTDSVGLVIEAMYDYRVLQAAEVTDPNGNRTVFSFTPLGLLAGVSIRGKSSSEGDQLRPGMRMEYDFLAYANSPPERRQPIFVRSIRHTHHDTELDVPVAERDETITTVEYSDGFGRLLQTRAQGDAVRFGDEHFGGGEGVLPLRQSDGAGIGVVGRSNGNMLGLNVTVSGWQVYDNKGRLVEKYEPFFSEGWDYGQLSDSRTGQRILTFYDPRGHAVRTVNPDGSEQTVIFGVPGSRALPDLDGPHTFEPTPWEAFTYNANDNAGRTQPEGGASYRHCWNTPASILIDALGRTIEAVERNRDPAANPGDALAPIEELRIRTTFDIRGNVLAIGDALGRQAFHEHIYDCDNKLLCMTSIDAGRRTSCFDAAGGVLEQRDAKGAWVLHAYDRVNRPLRLWARDGHDQQLALRQKLAYGDGGSAAQPAAERASNRAANCLAKLVRQFDEAGLLSLERYDFKGNLLEKTRHVIADDAILAVFDPAPAQWEVATFRVDWSNAPVPLDAAAFVSTLSYDALNRVKAAVYPADAEKRRRTARPRYNQAGTLDQLTLEHLDDGGALTRENFVERVVYNAKGQRVLIAYGNGVMTRHAYDPHNFRLLRLRSERFAKPAPISYSHTGDALQDYAYDYDLAGNLLRIQDRTPGCGIQGSMPGMDALDRMFSYDAMARLHTASGRECDLPADAPWDSAARSADLTKTRGYTEQYRYDALGNIKTLHHGAGGAAFKRVMTVAADNNRLSHVSLGALEFAYQYDASGNLTGEASSRHFEWDYASRLRAYRTQTGGSEPSVFVHYLYDAGGQRVKKLVRKQGGQVEATTYIDGSFEYQRLARHGVVEQNNTLHVMDDQSRIALVRIGPAFTGDSSPAVAYHLGEHLGGSNVVMDGAGAFFNREETTPFGETSFGSFARKRYRFSGKERDEESGLAYFGFRYYAPWLLKWMSCDPAGTVDGCNLYAYVSGNPLRFKDPEGLDGEEATPLEQAAASSSVENHVAGPPKPPEPGGKESLRHPAGESMRASHASGLIWTKTKQPDIDLSRATAPKQEDAVLAQCMSDSPRAVGAPVGDCRGAVAAVAVAVSAPAAVAGYEAATLRLAVEFPRAVAAGTLITAAINGNILPGGGSMPNALRGADSESKLMPEIREGIGVVADNNCFNRALAMDRQMAGAATSAVAEVEPNGVFLDQAEAVLKELYPNGKAEMFFSKFTLEKAARAAGEGTRGIVNGLSYKANGESHSFNFVVTNGKVIFTDIAEAATPNFGDYTEFHVFFTQLGRGR